MNLIQSYFKMKITIKNENEFFRKLHELCDEHNVVKISSTDVLFYNRWDFKKNYRFSIDTEHSIFENGSRKILELIYDKNNIKGSFTKKCKVLSLIKNKNK